MPKIKITANGKSFEIEKSLTISQFLLAQNMNPKRCVVEFNSKALKPNELDVELSDGDKLEIMSIVAGG